MQTPDGTSAPDPNDPLLGRLNALFAGRFKVERELTGGGMSRVFLAEEVALGRRIVIKILPPGIAAEINRERFRREIQFAARLQHPHIVPLLAAGEEGDLLYYTMPYIEPPLRGRVFSERMSVADVLEVLRDVTDALAYAHREGIIHRDIKPANVLLRDGHAVVTDFGVAKALASALATTGEHSSTGGAPATTTGMAIGTPAYMAPEQLAGDPAADHRVDIYALGLFAYELLTGKRPFRGPSPQAMLAAQLSGAPAPIADTRDDVPPVLVALIERCLEKDAHRRPSSAEAVLEVLKTIDFSSGTRRFVTPPPARGRRRAAAGLAAVLAVGAIGAWYAMSRPVAGAEGATGDAATTTVAAPAPVVDPAAASAAMDSLERRVIARVRDSLARQDSIRVAREERRRRAEAASASALEQERIAADRARDSVARAASLRTASASRTAVSGAPGSPTPRPSNDPPPPRPIGPEDFVARRDDMGPPRRVAVIVSAQIRNADAMIAAGPLRDSLRATIGTQARYRLISEDSIRAARATINSTSAARIAEAVGADMYVVLTTLPTNARGDTVHWQVGISDLTVHQTYRQRSTLSEKVAVAQALAFDRPKLLLEMLQHLEQLDRAPRR